MPAGAREAPAVDRKVGTDCKNARFERTVILVFSLFRLIRCTAGMRHDFLNAGRALGFFTFGWNECLRCAAQDGGVCPGTTAALLTIAVLGCTVPWTAVLGRSERPVVEDARRRRCPEPVQQLGRGSRLRWSMQEVDLSEGESVAGPVEDKCRWLNRRSKIQIVEPVQADRRWLSMSHNFRHCGKS
jgi:hypothetical protein